MPDLYEVERREAHKFLASIELCLRDNHIWRLPCLPDDFPLTGKETSDIQALWDAEWDRIKPAVEAQLEVERQAAAVEREGLVKRVEFLRAKFLSESVQQQARDRDDAKKSWPVPKATRVYDTNPESELQREHRNRIRNPSHHGYHPEVVHGFTEHHLYGPRGFKNPFKYEESLVRFTREMPTILPKIQYGKTLPLTYRPHSPLAEDSALSIVTAEICGDPPKGRSALEARASHA